MAYKSFTHFLLEKAMSPDEAMRVLNLSPGFTAAELKTARIKKAYEYHPDRQGGDVAMMQRVNNAFDALDNALKNNTLSQQKSADREADHQAHKEKIVAFAEVAKETFNKFYDAQVFSKHFESIFGQTFVISRDDWDKDTYSGTMVQHRTEWHNDGRNIVLVMHVSVYFDDMFKARTIAAPDTMLKMYIATEILYNRKKIKLTQANYRFDNRAAVLTNPEVVFPASKLKTQTSKSGTRKLSRRDVTLTFRRELGGESSDDWMYVPVGKYRIALFRMTFLGAAAWNIQGVYEKHRRVATPTGYVTFIENEPSMEFLWNNLKGLQANPPATAEEIAHVIEMFQQAHKERQRDEE